MSAPTHLLHHGLLFFTLAAWTAFTAAAPPPSAVHLSQAIQFRTISHQDPADLDPAPFVEFLAFLERTYPLVFSELEVDRIGGYSLLIRWPGSDPGMAPVLMDGHYDVVPVEPGTEGDWRFDPFGGDISDAYIHGRGALDNKAAVIVMLEGMEQLLRDGFAPERTLFFSIGHDEEVGGDVGAANIAASLEKQNVRFEFMLAEGGLIAEGHPLYPDGPVAQISLAQKGYVTLILSAEGEGGHAAAPTDNNAIVNLADAVSRLHHNPFEPRLGPPVSDMLEAFAPHVGGMTGFAFGNLWLTRPFVLSSMADDPVSRTMVRTTTAVTMFNGGIKENVIPQRAEARVNLRLLPGDTSESILSRVEEIIDDPAIEVTVARGGVIPRLADMSAPGYQKIASAIERVLPDAIVAPGLVPATTDSKHYEDLCDNVYHFQPFRLSLHDARSIHGTNERIRLDSMESSVALAIELIREVALP